MVRQTMLESTLRELSGRIFSPQATWLPQHLEQNRVKGFNVMLSKSVVIDGHKKFEVRLCPL
jgi:hypothetical protein